MSKLTKAAAAIVCLTRLGICSGFSQISASGDITTFISGQIEGLPSAGGGQYGDPGSNDIDTWSEALSLFYNGDVEESHEQFSLLGYRLIDFEDTNSGNQYHIISRAGGGENHWGIFIYNQKPCRSLVIQSPHPKYDTNTGHQGLYTFKELRARAFFVSGTHRCNAPDESECSGTTSACGSNSPFRISDLAHNASGIFQLTTQLHHEQFDEDVFVQFHGFGKDPSDPNAILSNGTRLTPQTDYIALLADAMQDDDPSLDFKIGHLDLTWDRLLAFTNTQGRLLNTSTDPCEESADQVSGKFIHIEQERELFRASETGWEKWINPMKRVFICQELTLGIDRPNHGNIVPNPVVDRVRILVTQSAQSLYVYSLTGKEKMVYYPADWANVDLSSLPAGVYFYQIRTKNDEIFNTGKIVKK